MERKEKQILVMLNLMHNRACRICLGLIPGLHKDQTSKLQLKSKTSTIILNKQYNNPLSLSMYFQIALKLQYLPVQTTCHTLTSNYQSLPTHLEAPHI